MSLPAFIIIGCGRIAQRHAEHIAKVGKLVAVCDIDTAKANYLARTYNADAYYDTISLFSALPKADVVAICSPNGLHAQHSCEALRKGYHVLVEKPMALTVEDCAMMIEAATTADKLIFPIKQNRYNPPVQAVKKAIDEGKLGKIYSFQLSCFWNRNADYYQNSWKGTLDLDGGTLFTQFSHFIDLLYWLLGDIDAVEAITQNYAHQQVIEFEDTGVVMFKFKSGVIGTMNYTVNSYRKNMEGSLTIFGEKGTVKIGGQYLNELEYQQIEAYEITNLPKGNPANQYGTYVGSMSNHDKVYQNVVDVLAGKKAMTTSAEEATKTVSIIQKIYQVANKSI